MSDNSNTDHELQHDDGPTWCIWCGTFAPYCLPGDCRASRAGTPPYDSENVTNRERLAAELFGGSEADERRVSP